jgi:hypothetical protein
MQNRVISDPAARLEGNAEKDSPLIFESGDFALNIAYPKGLPTLIPSEKTIGKLAFKPYLVNTSDTSDQDADEVPAVHIHAYHTKLLPQYFEYLSKSLNSADLYITTDSLWKRTVILDMIKAHSWAQDQKNTCIVVNNQGRNISALFRDTMPHLLKYHCALHLHTKASEESNLGDPWREDLLRTLLPEKLSGRNIVKEFVAHRSLGLLVPRTPDFMRVYQNWGDNFDAAMLLCSKIWPSRHLHQDAPLTFPVGMMFWFRPRALERLANTLNSQFQWPFEPIAWDGTCLHAVERLICHCVEADGFNWRPLASETDHFGSESAEYGKPDPSFRSQGDQVLSVWYSCNREYLSLCSMLAQQYKKSTQTLRERLCILNGENHELKEKNHAKEYELIRLRSNYQELELSSLAMIEEIRDSTSWRLTRPFRSISRLFSGVVRRFKR